MSVEIISFEWNYNESNDRNVSSSEERGKTTLFADYTTVSDFMNIHAVAVSELKSMKLI